MAIKKGDTVKVEYHGTFDDGTVFDSSVGRDPLEFKAGEGQVIKGFDDAVIGMETGQEKNVKIKPDHGYGNIVDSLVRTFPRSQFPKEPEPKEGMMILLASNDGRKFPARIVKADASNVTIDLNHPLAGKNLNFKIKIV